MRGIGTRRTGVLGSLDDGAGSLDERSRSLALLLQRLTLTSSFGSLAATWLGWLLVTGKWRPSRWRRAKQKPVVRSRGDSLRVIRGDEHDRTGRLRAEPPAP